MGANTLYVEIDTHQGWSIKRQKMGCQDKGWDTQEKGVKFSLPVKTVLNDARNFTLTIQFSWLVSSTKKSGKTSLPVIPENIKLWLIGPDCWNTAFLLLTLLDELGEATYRHKWKVNFLIYPRSHK